jgi:hypothetical protein
MKEPNQELIAELKRLQGYRPAETCQTCRHFKRDDLVPFCRLNPALKFSLDLGHTCDYHTPIHSVEMDNFGYELPIDYVPTGKEMSAPVDAKWLVTQYGEALLGRVVSTPKCGSYKGGLVKVTDINHEPLTDIAFIVYDPNMSKDISLDGTIGVMDHELVRMTSYTEIPGDTPKTEQLEEPAPEIEYPKFTGLGLRKWRKSLGMTQAELGAELGYASSTIGNAETEALNQLSGNMKAKIRAYVDGKK